LIELPNKILSGHRSIGKVAAVVLNLSLKLISLYYRGRVMQIDEMEIKLDEIELHPAGECAIYCKNIRF